MTSATEITVEEIGKTLAYWEKMRRVAAYHEAGHAVMAYHLHLRYRRVTIDPCELDDDCAGLCEGTGASVRIYPAGRSSCHYQSDRSWAERKILQILAGPEAERRYRRRRTIDPLTDGHDGGDYAQVRDLAIRLEGTSERATAYAEWLRLEARDTVGTTSFWFQVKAVARELHRHDALTAREVREVIWTDIARRNKRWRRRSSSPEGRAKLESERRRCSHDDQGGRPCRRLTPSDACGQASASAPPTAKYAYTITIPGQPAQRCNDCGKRFWVERRRLESCPRVPRRAARHDRATPADDRRLRHARGRREGPNTDALHATRPGQCTSCATTSPWARG